MCFLSCIAGIYAQFPLQLSTSTSQDTMSSLGGSTGIQSAEATCLSLCSLAEQHADKVGDTLYSGVLHHWQHPEANFDKTLHL